jgi:hypothetical protein
MFPILTLIYLTSKTSVSREKNSEHVQHDLKSINYWQIGMTPVCKAQLHGPLRHTEYYHAGRPQLMVSCPKEPQFTAEQKKYERFRFRPSTSASSLDWSCLIPITTLHTCSSLQVLVAQP